MEKEETNPFQGEWEILSCLPDHYGQRGMVWRFSESEKISYPDEEVVYKGRLAEYLESIKFFETEYFYYPAENRLSIDYSDYSEDGFLFACFEEHYRIEQPNEQYILLYGLEDKKTLSRVGESCRK